ncbi:colicin D domain-containing protein [Neisseria lisongii]|uniref:Colicin D domain-containing protein n=1 Tax=Neisseria lisongii TaxID=2912188 RepID=A0ABY7RNT3_9NEIS|nr:colicin D domain-containing protein [Neisseria lisongii]WCL72426.1 colicin D domain-containing protein [Neisseria lisongii]
MLGKQRAQLFRDGGLTAKEFARLQLDKNFKQVRLETLYDAIVQKPVDTRSLKGVSFSYKQLRDKFKHAQEAGIATKPNLDGVESYRKYILEVMNRSETRQFGRYLADKNAKVFYHEPSETVAVFTETNKFLSIWQFEQGSKQHKNYIKTGNLR